MRIENARPVVIFYIMDDMFELVRGCFGSDKELAEAFLKCMMLKEQSIATTQEKRDKSGFVYFLWSDGLCKIGMTNNIKTRVSILTCGNPDIKLIGYIPSSNMKVLEQRLHERYSKKRHKGEWFNITIKKARETITEFEGTVNKILLV